MAALIKQLCEVLCGCFLINGSGGSNCRLCKVLCGCFFTEDNQANIFPVCSGSKDDAPPATPIEQTSYHVFLSHRGPDTKHTVVDALRVFLESKGITCFVDYRLKEGVDFPSHLSQAIRNSQVHIVVLSQRFAESSWCLNEAAEIMELQPTLMKALVLPVFYGVRPEDVRWQRDGSAYDLKKLHKSRTAAERSRWSKALKALSQMNGFDWSDTASIFEGQMIQRIQSAVEEFLSGCLPKDIAVDCNKWASMYSTQMEQAEKALCSHGSDNDIVSVGILGPNRSEFAKTLFTKFGKDFGASCILLDVSKEQALRSKEGLLKLQSVLFSELTSSAAYLPNIHNTAKGRVLLLDRLKHIKCLIVIDDIDDNEEQLRSLLVLDKHQLGRGSRLVLTSRFPHVLHNRAQVDETISLWTGTGTEDQMEENKLRSLAICCESRDVHQGFIDHLCETFSMLGLFVCDVVGGADLLNLARKKQAALILVILSQSFNVDSPDVLERLNEASTCPGTKLVYILYGLPLLDTRSEASTSKHSYATARGVVRQGFSKNALMFPVDFQNHGKIDLVEFKSLINTIVMDHMQHDYRLSVTDFPVGLIKRQHAIENAIRGSSSERRKRKCIGILGMGGVGKTTIAKSLYNNLHMEFEGCAFLINVRARAKDESGLENLQMAIFDSVLGDDQVVKVKNVAEGSALLSKRLRGTHTLVILDDVDEETQLKTLFYPLDLAPGSVVIITSRERCILEAAGVDQDQVYEIDPLESNDARKLFYWHAFLRPFPPIGLRDITHKVIDACGGLPLALEVIGAHVYNHVDHQYWEETLDHLKGADHQIFKVLQVSVDALPDYQMEAFLDVCCFLIGKPHQTAQRIWSGCRWNAVTCMDVLKTRCLITVDPMDGTIGMHDQIRDMGRHIAQRRPLKTHIWDAMDAIHIPQAIDALRGFAWILQEEEVIDADAMQRLSRVKLFLLRNVKIEGGFPDLCYNELRWLQWQCCQFEVLPPGLYSRTLRVLDLSGSTQLEALWRNLHSSTKVPERLQELNLSGCKNLTELPQFDLFLHALEWFSLNGCERIDHLHSSIGSLTALKFLDLSGCESLGSLPDAIEDLHTLEKLLLSHCSLLNSLPQGIGRCYNLIEICLDHTGLITLPESFGDLTNLEKLTLNSCPNFTSLPSSIGGLEVLRICNLSDCPKLQELPDRFCELTNLDDLNLSNCDLNDLPVGIGNLHKLTSLSLWKNLKLRRLPSTMGLLRSLRILKLGFCPFQDDGIPEELKSLESLEDLDMPGTELLEIPQSFAHLGKLSRLYVHHSTKLERAEYFPSSLAFVDMGHCPRLQRVAGLDGLKSLEYLVLCNCYKLRELSGLGGLNSLQNVNISGCGSLYSRAVAFPQAVRRLQLSGSHVIPSRHLLQLPNLEHITCFGSEIPAEFENHIYTAVEAVENANELVMTIDIPSMSRHSYFAIVMCLVSHDQGWSDSKQEYGSYLQSPTFVEAVLTREGSREGTVQLLYRNRHAEYRDQMHMVILRHECKLLRQVEEQDKIEIRARSLYPAWRITVTQASYILVTDGLELLNARLQDISVWWVMNSIRSSPRAAIHSGHILTNVHALNVDIDVHGEPVVGQTLSMLMELWKHRDWRLFVLQRTCGCLLDQRHKHIHTKIRGQDSCIFCEFISLILAASQSNEALSNRMLPVHETDLVINYLDLDIWLLLQRKRCEWREVHQKVRDFFVRSCMLYLDENDHGSIDSQIVATLVAHARIDPVALNFIISKAIELEGWRNLFLVHGHGSMDLQSLPSTKELLLSP